MAYRRYDSLVLHEGYDYRRSGVAAQIYLPGDKDQISHLYHTDVRQHVAVLSSYGAFNDRHLDLYRFWLYAGYLLSTASVLYDSDVLVLYDLGAICIGAFSYEQRLSQSGKIADDSALLVVRHIV